MFSFLLLIIYLSFISLGLPDALLGSAWPIMHEELKVPLSYSGSVYMLISCCTILSSLKSESLNRRFGTGKITAFSVMLTALAIFGFSMSRSFYMLLLFAIPYGLGAGSVAAALNHNVALHYTSRHMNWVLQADTILFALSFKEDIPGLKGTFLSGYSNKVLHFCYS